MIEIKCTQDNFKLIPTIEVIPNPRNNNRHSIEQINYLSKLIKAHGFREPLLISNRSGFLIAGHGRLEAAKELGMEAIPAIFQDFASEAEEYQHMTADNEIQRYSELDYQNIYDTLKEIPEIDTELLGIENFVIPEIVEPKCDEDEVPEAPVEPKTKLGDIYKLGNHRLMCGDSTSIDAVEKLMDGNTSSLLLTDPPYGIGADTHAGKKENGWKQYNSNGWDLKKPDSGWWSIGSMITENQIVWGGNYFTDILTPSKCWLIWDKGQRDFSLADGELAWTSFDKALRIKTVSRASALKDGKVHPTQKSIDIIEWCIEISDKNSSKKSENILDLFGGSGSTLIACEKTNRKCFMMELDPKYCDVIVARWEKFTGKKAELLTNV